MSGELSNEALLLQKCDLNGEFTGGTERDVVFVGVDGDVDDGNVDNDGDVELCSELMSGDAEPDGGAGGVALLLELSEDLFCSFDVSSSSNGSDCGDSTFNVLFCSFSLSDKISISSSSLTLLTFSSLLFLLTLLSFSLLLFTLVLGSGCVTVSCIWLRISSSWLVSKTSRLLSSVSFCDCWVFGSVMGALLSICTRRSSSLLVSNSPASSWALLSFVPSI